MKSPGLLARNNRNPFHVDMSSCEGDSESVLPALASRAELPISVNVFISASHIKTALFDLSTSCCFLSDGVHSGPLSLRIQKNFRRTVRAALNAVNLRRSPECVCENVILYQGLDATNRDQREQCQERDVKREPF